MTEYSTEIDLLARGAVPHTDNDGRNVVALRAPLVFELLGGEILGDGTAWSHATGTVTQDDLGVRLVTWDETDKVFRVEGDNPHMATLIEQALMGWAAQSLIPDVIHDLEEMEGGGWSWKIAGPSGESSEYRTNRNSEGLWADGRQILGHLQWDMSGLTREQAVMKIRRRFGGIAGDAPMSGAHLRALRTALGLSVKDLAEWAGVAIGSARCWDTGRYRVPSGVVAELEELKDQTDRAVADLADHYAATGGPMVIPRTPEDMPWTVPGVVVPEGVTLDWWKLVAVRVCDRVPGLTVEWPTKG